jgi:two-component system, NtrC family, response regulator AtoC
LNKIILIDDDPDTLNFLDKAINKLVPDVAIATISEPSSLKFELLDKDVRVCLLDLSLSQDKGVESGFEAIKLIKTVSPTTSIIVLTGYGKKEYGVRALALGAVSFLQKPVDLEHLRVLIIDGINQANLRTDYHKLLLVSASSLEKQLIGNSESTKRLREQIFKLGLVDVPVLITGETGTGKGVCARAIHMFGKRAQGKFVRYQPNFNSSEMLNSELFGHKKGSYTGALNDRKGLVSEANQGTLFLDEMTEFPINIQILLLTVLQDKVYRIVGDNTELKSDFRLICASNQNIEELIKSGRFRSDLYHRIASVRLHLEPLRFRKDDIPSLIDSFLSEFSLTAEIKIRELSSQAISQLVDYNWPGNVRELKSVLENAVILASLDKRSFISEKDIVFQNQIEKIKKFNVDLNNKSFNSVVEEFKVNLIRETLESVAGNESEAARLLKMERSTLRRILSRNKD